MPLRCKLSHMQTKELVDGLPPLHKGFARLLLGVPWFNTSTNPGITWFELFILAHAICSSRSASSSSAPHLRDKTTLKHDLHHFRLDCLCLVKKILMDDSCSLFSASQHHMTTSSPLSHCAIRGHVAYIGAFPDLPLMDLNSAS